MLDQMIELALVTTAESSPDGLDHYQDSMGNAVTIDPNTLEIVGEAPPTGQAWLIGHSDYEVPSSAYHATGF